MLEKNRHRFVFIGFSVLIAATFSIIDLNAQSTRTLDAAARRIDEFRKQNEKAIHDGMAKDAKVPRVSPEEQKRAAAIREQLREDFESLQTEYNGLITKLKSKEPFAAAETTAVGERVHSTSTRLLKNLYLPGLAEAAKGSDEPATIRPNASLKTLCLKIFAFITHPMFETPSTIDLKTSAEARAVLEEIISISDSLRQAK